MAFCSSLIIWLGVIFGLLDWISDIAYYANTTFQNKPLKGACATFILFQPLWYVFIYGVYMASHTEINSNKDRFKKVAIAPLYGLLQYTKVLAGFTKVHEFFISKLALGETFHLLTLENCFKVQILTELILETLPQIIIQVTNNNMSVWTSVANFSFLMSLFIFIKNVTILTVYTIRKFIDNKERPEMRPKTEGRVFGKAEKVSSVNIKSYLMDPNDDGIDEEGNTSIHQLTKFEDMSGFEAQIANQPHQLFMLNKLGFTPLDAAINEQDDVKAKYLIDKMSRFNNNCNLKFVKRPNRLELKFEKSLTLAINKNNSYIIQAFPSKQIKTVYISTSQFKDYKQYKGEKAAYSEMITTPLHLACKLSNDEAVRLLVETHSFDVNTLLREKSALFELLNTSNYLDFNILNYLMKKKKPCINSGTRLPLNQAIMRGNPFIIKTLIEFGKPNPYVSDINGKTPLHIAAAKLDTESFDLLVAKGADPMMPDKVGNTILHIMVFGTIRDVEYDFIKQMIQKYGLRLTRNCDNKTPLNIIRSYSSKPAAQRGQPNFKKILQDYLEEKIRENPNFQDSERNEEIHEAIIRGNLQEVKAQLTKQDSQDGQALPKQLQLLEQRNYEGKTSIMLAIEHEREEIVRYLLDTYPQLNLDKQDTKDGNTTLHLACLKEHVEIATRIFNIRPKLCLRPNYSGQTPIHIATQKKNLQTLQLFQEYKQDCLLMKDALGENPLFMAAREGDAEIFKWYSGNIDFFKARGDQNYKGQTIEHIVCLYQRTEIVDAIKPRPDTKDYYGNLPIFYSLMKNDVEMIKKYFKKGREYFNLRNFKFETIFHIAARYNSLESITELLGRSIFVEELLKKDYKGDTPIHIAAKSGSLQVLEFYVTACTKSFLEMQNDFGFTAKESVKEKLALLEEKKHKEEDVEEEEQADKQVDIDEKVARLEEIIQFFDRFENYVTDETWRERFEVPLNVYLEQFADSSLIVFMEMQNQVSVNTSSPLTKVKSVPIDAI